MELIQEKFDFDFRLLPNSTYRMVEFSQRSTTTEMTGNTDKFTQGNELFTLENLTKDSELNQYESSTVVSSTNENGLFIAIQYDSIDLGLKNVLAEGILDQSGFNAADKIEQQLSTKLYGHSENYKIIKIDSVVSEKVVAEELTDMNKYPPGFSIPALLKITGGRVWNEQEKLPSGTMAIKDTFTYRPQVKERKKKTRFTKEKLSSIKDSTKRAKYQSMITMEEGLNKQQSNTWTKYILEEVKNNIAHFKVIDHKDHTLGSFMKMTSEGEGVLEYDLSAQHYRYYHLKTKETLVTKEDDLKSKIESQSDRTIKIDLVKN